MDSRVTLDLAHAIAPLRGSVSADGSLYDIIGDASVVLIGEATLGTHEFYRARVEITKRLILDHGFTAVCIEDDWPDAYRVNRYVRGAGDAEAIDSLDGFKRFPSWMWRNSVILEFVAWLREYNDRAALSSRPKTGFYGLDLYSMYASIDTVLRYGTAAERAAHPSCRDEVVAELLDIQRHASRYAKLDGQVGVDQYFYAEQNARVAAGAEAYYRAMLDDSISMWNLRNRHMIDTLQRLLQHLSERQGATKAVVWAHNATNVGAPAREAFGRAAVSIGFTTYTGTVTAASEWQAPPERKRVVPGRGDSYEYLFHSLNVPRFLVPLRPNRPKLSGLPVQARERSIGPIYRPQTELYSHYFTARLIDQFDAVYHFDVTHALEPLDGAESWRRGELSEGVPSRL